MTWDSDFVEELLALERPLSRARQAVDELRLRGASPSASARERLKRLADEAARLAFHMHQLTGATGDLIAPAPLSADITRALTSPPVILAIDDDDATLQAIAHWLAEQFVVHTTSDPRKALGLVHELRPDIVLSDLRMPELDGVALLEAAKSDPSIADIPWLFLTGVTEPTERIRALNAGALDCIAKPIDGKELSTRLAHAVVRSRQVANERALQLTDELTGLGNRRSLRSFLAKAIESARHANRCVSVAMIDQDGLKQINDRFGHAAGDKALQTVANALAECRRADDLAARIGGDEFALILVGADVDGAAEMLKRVVRCLQSKPLVLSESVTLFLAISYGIAGLRPEDPPEAPEALLSRADAALYEAKRGRKKAIIKDSGAPRAD